MNSNLIKKILFDPLSWMDSSHIRLTAGLIQTETRSLINQVLLRQFRLTVDPWQPGDGFNRYMAEHWYSLPAAAFLLGCVRYRAMLCHHGVFWRLPAEVRQFASLNILPAERGEVQHDNPLVWVRERRVNELLAYESLFEEPLRQRLRLSFPQQETEHLADQIKIRASLTPMILAIQHAERYGLHHAE